MVYLAELLVVMTNGLKIVRIMLEMCLLTLIDDDDAFLASPSVQESDGVLCSMSRGAVLLKQKKSSPDNMRMSGSGF